MFTILTEETIADKPRDALCSRQWRGESPLQKSPPPHMCYHVKFGRSASKGVCINRRESSKKLGEYWGPAPFGMEGVADRQNTPSATCVTLPNVFVLR